MGSYIISIAKITFMKIGALIHSMNFVSSEVALYLYKSTLCPCMEYCCHVWAGAASCSLELLDKLQKQICRTVGFSVATSVEILTHHWNVASLSLFYRYYIDRCLSELLEPMLQINIIPLLVTMNRKIKKRSVKSNFQQSR